MSSRGRPASVDVDPQNESMQEVQHIVESNAGTQSITRKVPNQSELISIFSHYETNSVKWNSFKELVRFSPCKGQF